MNKKILVIIGGRGIGDLIYHLPLLRSLYKTYKKKLFILSNKINKASQVYKNENFYKKIISFDNERYNLIKTIKKIFILKNKINKFNPDLIIVTSNTKRLVFPVLLSNAKEKKIMGTGNFFFNKDNSLNQLKVSEQIIKFTNSLNLKKVHSSFFLNNNYKSYNKKKKIFFNIDSHHDQNNWDLSNFIFIIKKLINTHKIFVNFSPNKNYLINFFPEEIKISSNIEFTYKKTISEIIEIINDCNCIIGNESGPICLAASLKKKVHALYIPLYTKPESAIINQRSKYYNVDKISSKRIIQKILKSI